MDIEHPGLDTLPQTLPLSALIHIRTVYSTHTNLGNNKFD